MYVILLPAVDNTKECGVSQTANCVFPENGKDNLRHSTLSLTVSYIRKDHDCIFCPFYDYLATFSSVSRFVTRKRTLPVSLETLGTVSKSSLSFRSTHITFKRSGAKIVLISIF